MLSTSAALDDSFSVTKSFWAPKDIFLKTTDFLSCNIQKLQIALSRLSADSCDGSER